MSEAPALPPLVTRTPLLRAGAREASVVEYPHRRRRSALSFGVAIALIAALLVVVDESPVVAADPCGPSGNQITCENSKPGVAPEVWDIDGAGDSSIQGFSTDISVNVGNRVDFKIDSDARRYTIDIYRTGWYQGLGARKVASVTPSATLPQRQPQCISDVVTELYDCGTWAVSASWEVPATAVSGVYVALLTRTDTGGQSHITFVVRDLARQSDVLFQTSDPTWHAYNAYGGSNFYQGAANGRAYKISYNRPFATRGGLTQRDFYFGNEYPAVRFLEQNGYDVSYFSGVDTDRFGSELLDHRVFLSVGHDEYWSGAQRDNVTAARDAGVNLQFLSGNEIYWRTRYEPSADGAATPYRTLVSYKETWDNAKTDPSSEWTGTWRDPRFAPRTAGAATPENELTGTIFRVNQGDLPVTVSSLEGKLRLWRNTSLDSLTPGTTQALAPHTVGYESDEDLDNGFRPPGLIHLSTTVGAVDQVLTDFGNTVAAGSTTHHLTLYRAASGALVFGAGTVQWTWGLDQEHDGNGAPADPRMRQAQVNLLADMGAQPYSLAAPLVASAASTDITAPVVTITAPASGASVANGAKVTIAGTASDVGGQVAGVEVSTDGGVSWRAAAGTTDWSYSYYQQGSGATTVQVRAIDDSANYPQTPSVVDLVVGGPFSVFGEEPPATPDSGDPGGSELGLRFTPEESGFITGVRFFKSAANTGTHTGSLWDATGNRLATVTFANETGSGWQSAAFTSTVAVTAGQDYVVSYSAPNGHYSATPLYWSYRGRDAGPLTVAGGYGTAPAGVYSWSPGSFPTNHFQQSNYFVDALFSFTDTSPLTATNQLPLPGSTSVPTDTTISAVLSRPVDPSSVGFTVTSGGDTAVPGAVAYNAETRAATFTPSAPLDGGTEYTVTLTAEDSSGIELSGGQTWTFTTAQPATAEGVCPCSLFDDLTAPQVPDSGDTAAVTLGVRFSSESDGVITGVKFYKGSANIGSHVGSLWDASGKLLASATFTEESTAGWQTVTFPNPVPVSAGAQYTAAYRTTVGHYSVTPGGFADSYARGPLSVPANGGSFSYADGFPGNQSSTNYLVDLVFEPAQAPITVVTLSPADGATDVDPATAVRATLSTAVADGYQLSVSVQGTSVPGATTLSPDRKMISFVPTDPLPTSTEVDASLTNVASRTGTELPPQAWSFTTATVAPVYTTHNLLGTQTPVVSSATNDTSPVELGMSFSTSAAGSVTAIRFYKGSGNTGSHTGSLWSSTGERLATVTFADESATGWQTAELPIPVELTVGQTYVVSYFAPNGGYSYTSGFFETPLTSGPLTAGTAENGRFLYGASGGYPTNSWQASNYFVDVTFRTTSDTAPEPVTMTSSSPADGATGVDPSTAITAELSAATSGEPPTLAVSSSSGNVAGTSAYDSTTNTVSFSPSAALAQATTYTATVSVAGTPVGTWSFTTAEATPPPPATVLSTTPGSDATDVAPTVTVSAELSAAPTQTPTLGLTSGAGAVAGTSTYDPATLVVSFTPAEPLAWSTNYTATVSVDGATPTGGSWSFSTAAEPPSVDALTIFAENSVPDTPAWDDVNAAQVGVRFSSEVAGTVTGIRFYKGSQNTGAHEGYLWSSTGTRLATVSFTAESDSGWQSASFSQPVTIQPGVEYRASYHSTGGRYSVTLNGLADVVTNGPLSTPAQGSVYLYGTDYPANLSSHNYWVDVFFVPAE
ncbi:MAG: DUF4082 domain-containing protein [Homoserinimonas sp.]